MGGSRFILAVFLFAGISQNYGQKTKEVTPDSNIKGRLLTVAEGCGSPKLTSINRIVGGGPAKEGAWPWFALLGNSHKPNSFACGGTLITTRHILTAAHCFYGHLNTKGLKRSAKRGKFRFDFVRLGEYDTSASVNKNRVDIGISSVIAHEQYVEKTETNDIAIANLEHDVKFTDYIRPICLPTSKSMQSRSFVGDNPFVVGYGNLGKDQKRATVLQQLQVPVITNDQCKKNFEKGKRDLPGFEYRYNESYVLCAGFTEGGKDACQGDSGGPLMLPIFENGRFPYYQIGLVSYGTGCTGESEVPGVYTNIRRYIDWITKKLDSTKK